MNSHRTTARGVFLLLLVAALAATSAAASPLKAVPRLVFPVVGPVTYTNDFGAPRGRSGHQGNDLMAPRRALAVAVEAGRVKFHTTSWAAGCMLYLHGVSGTTYLYIHLNNDLTKDNDNRGKCVPGVAYAPGLKSGARVAAGDLVGYVGDSGDANGGSPHLHFEVHPNDGAAVTPYPYLQKARKLLYTARAGTVVKLALTGTILGVENGRLSMKVSSVRVTPGNVVISKLSRTLVLEITDWAVVQRLDGIQLPLHRAVKFPTKPVVVWTEPAGTSLPEKLGAAGALVAERVVLNR